MRFANKTSTDALAQAGLLIEEIMEVVPVSTWNDLEGENQKIYKERIQKQLTVHGLVYLNGGRIIPSGTVPPVPLWTR